MEQLPEPLLMYAVSLIMFENVHAVLA